MKFLIVFIHIALLGRIYANISADSLFRADSLAQVSPLNMTILHNWEFYDSDKDKPLFDSNRINFIDESKAVNPLSSKINYSILAGLSPLYIASGIGLHYYQSNAPWKNTSLNTGKFAFRTNWNDALYMDKMGHFYSTQLIAHAFSGSIEAAGIQAEESTWYSASLALLYELYTETEDGFYPSRAGFDLYDASASFLGSTFYVFQYYYPYLYNFQFRFSYLPSENIKNNSTKNIFHDYEGQRYWVSLKVKNMLPDNAAKYWPAIFNIAAGMGAKSLNTSGNRYHEFYLALDLDAGELPLYGKFWQFVKNSLNFFHFPMPGVRFTPKAKFFVLCF